MMLTKWSFQFQQFCQHLSFSLFVHVAFYNWLNCQTHFITQVCLVCTDGKWKEMKIGIKLEYFLKIFFYKKRKNLVFFKEIIQIISPHSFYLTLSPIITLLTKQIFRTQAYLYIRESDEGNSAKGLNSHEIKVLLPFHHIRDLCIKYFYYYIQILK